MKKRSLKNNSIFIFTFVFALILAPAPSFAIYSLSAFYANVQSLVFSYIGATETGQTGFVTNAKFAAGVNDAQFSNVTGTAIDSTNNFLYVIDYYNHRVQKFVASTGAFVGAIGNSTLSGTCVAGKQTNWCVGGQFKKGTGDGMFNYPANLAIDITNDRLYAIDSGRVQKFVLSTGAYVGTIGFGGSATGTCIVGKQSGWCTGGTFTANTPDGGFPSPVSILVDSVGDLLYVGDQQNAKIQKFTLSTGAFFGAIGKSTVVGTNCAVGKQTAWCKGGYFQSGVGDGMFSIPTGLAFDKTNNFLFVVDSSNNRIQKFILSTGAFVGVIGKSTTVGTNCTVGSQTSWCTGGSFSLGLADGQFQLPIGIGVDVPNNVFYITDGGNNRMQKFTLSTGVFVGAIGASSLGGTCVAGVQTSWCTGGAFARDRSDGGFNAPASIALDLTNNRMYVADDENRIQKINLSTMTYGGGLGTIISPLPRWTQSEVGSGNDAAYGDGTFASTVSVAIDVAGDLMYVSEIYQVQKFVLSSGAYIGSIGYSSPKGTCVQGAQTGWCTGGVFSKSSVDGGFYVASQIALDVVNDRMYVGEANNYRVQKFVLSTGAFIGAIGKSTLSGTCIAGKQTSWCAGGAFTNGAGDGFFNSVMGLAIDTINNFMYVTDGNSYRVQKFVLSTGAFIGAIGYTSSATGTCVSGKQTNWCTGGTFVYTTAEGSILNSQKIAIDPSHDNFYIAAGSSGRIQKFTLSTGAYVGAIGYSNSAGGTCIAGKQNGWCTGGSFSGFGGYDGQFGFAIDVEIDATNGFLYTSDAVTFNIQKFSLTTGAYIGSIGNSTTEAGTCLKGKQKKWCTGGTFATGAKPGQFIYPGGIAIDSVNKRIYITDKSRIIKITQ